jgi:membrane protein DedA with SNARE-associated domain
MDRATFTQYFLYFAGAIIGSVMGYFVGRLSAKQEYGKASSPRPGFCPHCGKALGA